MKHLKQLFVFALLAWLGCGQVWGAEAVYKQTIFSANNNEKGVQNYSSTWTNTTDGFVVTTVNANNNNNGWGGAIKIGTKTNASTGTITTNAAIDKAITKVVLTIDAVTYASNVTSVTLKTSSNGSSWTSAGTFTKEAGAKTVTLTSPTANLYYQIEVVCTGASKNGCIQLSQVDFYAEESGDDPGTPQTTVCATPTFSPETGVFTSAQSVTISCATENSTIYYTTDGSDPTTSSSVYSSAISVSGTTTIKAIAVASGMTNSSVASAAYTILTPLTTMDAIYSAATTTNTDVAITFNNWVVSGVKGNKAYVTNGTKGFVINQANHGFVVNNVLSGTAICKLQLNSGNAQLSELTSTTTGLSVTTGGTVTPVEVSTDDIAALEGINTGSVITISGACTTNNNKYYINGVQLWNNLFSFTNPTQGNNYSCTGVYYYGGNTYGNEIMPRSAEDLTEIVVVGAPATPTFEPKGGTYTEVKNVVITSETENVTIYYTTDGTTPTTESSVYATPISVGEDMTIMAIAVDENGTSSVATATYDINLPEDETVQKTFDLSTNQTTTATESEMTWVATNVTVAVAKGSASTATNNYYPGTTGKSYTSTRFYSGSNLAITPNNKQISTIVFLATSESYATALQSSTWTNATAVIDGNNKQKVIVTAHCAGPISAAITGTCGFTEIKVQYGAIVTTQVTLVSNPIDENILLAAYTEDGQTEKTAQELAVIPQCTKLNLQYASSDNYRLKNWTLNEGSDSEISVENDNVYLMVGAQNVTATANFDQAHAINGLGTITGGTISANKSAAFVGETITLSQENTSGYVFAENSWVVTKASSGTITVTDNQFTMPDEAVTITATFNEVETYAITVGVANANEGIASFADDSDTKDLIAGATASIKAEPARGYAFAGWTYDNDFGVVTFDNSSSQTTTLTVPTEEPADALVYATFTALSPASVTLSAAGVETTFSDDVTPHYVGDEITLPETAGQLVDGKTFMGWSSVAITTPQDAPTENFYAPNGTYTIATTSDKLYAVYATAGTGAATSVLSEDFASISAGDNTTSSGSSSQWSVNANFNSSIKNGVYQAGGAIRLGKSGVLETKPLDLSGGTVTVEFKLKGWSTTENTISVQVDDQTVQSATCTGYMSTGNFESKSLTFAAGTTTSTVKFTTTSSVRVFVDDINVKVAAYGDYTTSCTASLPHVATPTFTLTEGTYTTSTESVGIECETEDATIYYVINEEEITEENRIEYENAIPLNARGIYTITAQAVKEGYQASETATATYTINLPFASVSELFTYITDNSLTTLSDVIVTGYVSKIVTPYNSQYENVTYNIVDINNDGEIFSDALQCYRGKGVKGEGDTYTGAEAIAVGDKVTVTGNYKVHTDGTKELDAGNYIITRIAATMTGIEIAGDLDNTSYHLYDAISYEGLSVNEVYSTGLKVATVEEVTWSYSPADAMTVAGEDKEVTITGQIGTGENEKTATKDVTITVEALKDPQLAFTENMFYVEPNGEFTAPTLTYASGFNGTVTYSTESNLVTVDGATGAVTIGSVGGTAVIVASSAATATFSAGEATYTIVIDSRKHVSSPTNGFAAVSGTLNDEISYASYKGDGTGDPNIKNNAIQIYQITSGKSSGGYITVTATTGCKIDQVKITTNTNATTVAYSKDGGSISESSNVESEADYLTDAGLDAQTVNIYCMSTSSSNRLFIASMTVYYTGEAVDELSSIELSGDYNTEFNVGDPFNHNGLVVTAHYTVGEDAIVTDAAVVSAPDMSIRGQKTVTVSYTEGEITKTASYQITVNSTEAMVDEPVVLIAQKDSKFYAMKKLVKNSAFEAVEVTYSGGDVIVTAEATKEAITWYMSDIEQSGDVMFATAAADDNTRKFMTGTTGETDMSLSNSCEWTWDDTYQAYVKGTRTPLYNGNGFKNYATSNIGNGTSGSYSTVLQFVPASSIRVQAVEISTSVTEAEIAAEADVVVHNGGVVTVGNDVTWSDLTVEAGSVIDLTGGGTITTTNFIIQATNTSSNQVIGATNGVNSNIQSENIYFEKDFVEAGHHWYNVAVPFNVDINGGIQTADGRELEWDTHFNFYYYDGANRALNGKGNNWIEETNQLQPGVNYQCVFDQAYGAIRFKKAADANINNGANITAQAYSSEHPENANWNGIANNGLTYAQATMTGIAVIQVLNADGTAYEPQTLAGFVMVVGVPFFVQGAGTFTFTNGTDPIYSAPQRTSDNSFELIAVELKNNGQRVDRLYVSASEDAIPAYEVGKDVAKFTSNNTAQLWVNNYNEKLCVNDVQLVDDQAIYDLGLYAPAAGTYSISAQQVEGATLYVTYNGAIIWNLSLGDYELDLTRGTTTGYGLLLVAQPNQMPTGVENGELLNGENGVQKILLNGQLYILRDGHLYDAVGKEMK